MPVRSGPCLTLVLAVLFLSSSTVFAQSQPNFTGEWRMDASKSDFGKFPVPTALTRNIVQKNPDLSIDTTQLTRSGANTAHVNYRTDGVETTNQLSTGEGTSHAFWDGSTLVIRTTLKNRAGVDVLMEERWDLSADGQTLTTTSHIETSKGNTDLKLVCERVK
jgi:hypothetical protein